MTTTPTSNPDVRALYNQYHGDLSKVAEHLGIPYSEFVSRYGSEIAPTEPRRGRTPPTDLGEAIRAAGGPKTKHIISHRHADSPYWPREHEKVIAKARLDYEAGTHELCQGREGNWFVLYCIPRQVRSNPRKFFQTY